MNKNVESILTSYNISIEKLNYLILDFDLGYLQFSTDTVDKTVTIEKSNIEGKVIYYRNFSHLKS